MWSVLVCRKDVYQCGTNNVDIGPYGLCWSVGRLCIHVGPRAEATKDPEDQH